MSAGPASAGPAPLPRIMVAPNGARRSRQDHPALPVTIPQVVSEAVACHTEGAEALHAHVRDGAGLHILDAGLYRELLTELSRAVPAMAVQITTEAVGRYAPAEQMALVRDLLPRFASVALREMVQDDNDAGAFYRWAFEAGIGIQHILYSVADVRQLADMIAREEIPASDLEAIFVLGRYGEDRDSTPRDLVPFLKAAEALPPRTRWAACAFGRNETACLVAALRQGGKARVGFENNLLNADGSRATNNAGRVRELMAAWRADAAE